MSRKRKQTFNVTKDEDNETMTNVKMEIKEEPEFVLPSLEDLSQGGSVSNNDAPPFVMLESIVSMKEETSNDNCTLVEGKNYVKIAPKLPGHQPLVLPPIPPPMLPPILPPIPQPSELQGPTNTTSDGPILPSLEEMKMKMQPIMVPKKRPRNNPPITKLNRDNLRPPANSLINPCPEDAVMYQCTFCTFKSLDLQECLSHTVQKHPDTVGKETVDIQLDNVGQGTVVSGETENVEVAPDLPSLDLSDIDEPTTSASSANDKDQLSERLMQQPVSDPAPKKRSRKQNLKATTNSIPEDRPTQEVVVCEYCDFSTGFRPELDEHRRKNHLAEMRKESVLPKKVYNCHVCEFTSATDSYLIKHMKEVHKLNALSSCEKCGATFTSNARLVYHLKRDHPTTIYTCHICQSEFWSDMTLKKHLRNVHENQVFSWACGLCAKEFTRRYEVVRHYENFHQISMEQMDELMAA